eukprot:m.51337 g.51337  ORF g.51337 m.51337 type:complete len:394 (-) comp11679_c0_seq1:37-1218(-)
MLLILLLPLAILAAPEASTQRTSCTKFSPIHLLLHEESFSLGTCFEYAFEVTGETWQEYLLSALKEAANALIFIFSKEHAQPSDGIEHRDVEFLNRVCVLKKASSVYLVPNFQRLLVVLPAIYFIIRLEEISNALVTGHAHQLGLVTIISLLGLSSQNVLGRSVRLALNKAIILAVTAMWNVFNLPEEFLTNKVALTAFFSLLGLLAVSVLAAIYLQRTGILAFMIASVCVLVLSAALNSIPAAVLLFLSIIIVTHVEPVGTILWLPVTILYKLLLLMDGHHDADTASSTASTPLASQTLQHSHKNSSLSRAAGSVTTGELSAVRGVRTNINLNVHLNTGAKDGIKSVTTGGKAVSQDKTPLEPHTPPRENPDDSFYSPGMPLSASRKKPHAE